MLAHIAGVMDSEFFFEIRCIKFIKMALVFHYTSLLLKAKLFHPSLSPFVP